MNFKTFYKIFFVLFFAVLLSFGSTAANATSAPADVPISRQIEIITHEINVLRTLIENANLREPIDSAAYIAVDLSSGSTVLEKNASWQYPIASVTKLMTAVISLENTNTSLKITLTDQMLTPAGQSPVLYSGLQITAKDLLTAMLTQSSNDAAEALSYFVGKDQFINLMNQKATEIRMDSTAFYNAHGLTLSNVSTPSNLAKLIAYINQKHPEIWEITKENNFWLPDQNGQFLKFQNVNNFYYLGSFVGGKTGYLAQAKQSFASIFNVNGKQVAIVVLYSKNRMADIFSILGQLQVQT